MSFEIDGQTGTVLTETQQGCTQPADYSFACVNDFVHRVGVQYEDLESLCLGLASHIEKLKKRLPKERPYKNLSDEEILKAVIDINPFRYKTTPTHVDYAAYDLAIARAVLREASND